MINNNEFKSIINIINTYFPCNVEYDSYEYQNSKQFILYKKKENK